MSDTFPDETLYPVLTSLADEDRIFASNSAAGHESSQIKGSTIKKTSAYTFHNGGEVTGVPWVIHGCNGTVVLTLPTGVPIGTEIGVFAGVTAVSTVTITRAGSDNIYTPSGSASSFSVTGFGRYFTVVKTISSAWMICGLEDSAIAAALGDVVKLTGNQSIGGVKTFTSSPVMPTPTAGDNTTKGATTAFVAGAIASCRPKHSYVAITTASTAIAAERGNTYGVNATGCTLNLPSVGTAGYVDGDEICVVVGVSGARELTITSPSQVLRGTGLQPANTPFNVTGLGLVITFTKISTAWTMSYPEYELAGKAPLASPALTGTPTAPTAAAGTNTTQLATTAFVAGAIASCRPKHSYVAITTASTAIDAERGKTYGVNANGCTLTLPDTNTSGYVDGDEICVVVGVSGARELTITSPSNILRGTGIHPKNTPFTLTGFGTFITFTKYSNVWMMGYPEYELSLKAPLASPALTGTPTAPTAAPGTNTTQIATTAFVQAAVSGALMLEGTPSGPTASGTKGMARFDADYFYVCTATNTWVRFPKDGSWTE